MTGFTHTSCSTVGAGIRVGSRTASELTSTERCPGESAGGEVEVSAGHVDPDVANPAAPRTLTAPDCPRLFFFLIHALRQDAQVCIL